MTTTGPDQPTDMADVVLLAGGQEEACTRLEGLFADGALERRLRKAGPAYVGRFDWNSIADRHVGHLSSDRTVVRPRREGRMSALAGSQHSKFYHP